MVRCRFALCDHPGLDESRTSCWCATFATGEGPMTFHPRERSYTRREVLVRAGGAAVSLSSVSGFLAACGNSTGGATTGAAGGWPVGPGGIPLARASHPVTLKRWEDPIASGMKPETGGTFTIFNYPAYID